MMILLELVLYCLLFFLLVKGAARNSGRNCLYFYSKEYLDEAQKRGIADKESTMKKGKRFMISFCIVMFVVLVLIFLFGIMSLILRQPIFRRIFSWWL